MCPIITDEIQKYVDEVCGLIRNKKIHKSIKDELTSHIEELTLDYMDLDLSEEEAVRKAIEQMGSAAVVGKDLNKVHKAAPDLIVLGLTGIFVSIGLFVLWFIQENNIISDRLSYINYFKNSMIYLIGGLVLAFAIFKVDYRTFKKYSKFIYTSGVILLMVTFFFGNHVGGALKWIRVGNISLNTLVISPYIIIIGLSGIFENWNWNSSKYFILGLVLVFIPGVLILLTPSIADFSIYLIGVTAVLIISGLKIKHIIYVYVGIMTIGVTCILRFSYRIERVKAWINPWQYADGAGWMAMKIAELSKNTGFFGKGAELSKNIMPEIHTDYVFTFMVYCFGWIVGILVIALICAFIVRIGFMGSKVKDKYGKLIVCGFCGLIATQFILSILANTNVLPIISVSMPFISYGGSSLVINILSVSLISNIFKWRNTPYKEVCA